MIMMPLRIRGLTLVEVLIALAIAALMTLTGWRAIDTLQTSRDRIVSDAAQWHALDDFFVTLEADLRRAELSDFAGHSQSMAFLLAPTGNDIDPKPVRYRLAPQPPAADSNATPSYAIVRDYAHNTIAIAIVQDFILSYSTDGRKFIDQSSSYPHAIRLRLLPVGAKAPVERLLALR